MVLGGLTGVRYRDEILHPIVRLYAGAIIILMDDNARPHRDCVVNDYLRTETIESMDWSSLSPDLNPIEHAWDMFQRTVSARQNLSTNRQELIHVTALTQE